MPNMACLLYYTVIKQALSKKQETFTFKRGLNRGTHSSPSEMIMRNSILQTLLTRICLICSFMLIILVLFGAK